MAVAASRRQASSASCVRLAGTEEPAMVLHPTASSSATIEETGALIAEAEVEGIEDRRTGQERQPCRRSDAPWTRDDDGWIPPSAATISDAEQTVIASAEALALDWIVDLVWAQPLAELDQPRLALRHGT